MNPRRNPQRPHIIIDDVYGRLEVLRKEYMNGSGGSVRLFRMAKDHPCASAGRYIVCWGLPYEGYHADRAHTREEADRLFEARFGRE